MALQQQHSLYAGRPQVRTAPSLYAPPAYLFEELPVEEKSLAVEGMDPLITAVNAQQSSWPVAALSSSYDGANQASGAVPSQGRAVGQKSSRDALNAAAARGELPFLSIGTSGTEISKCTPEAMLKSVSSIAEKVKRSVAAGDANRDVEKAMMTQYFMDLMAWQRMEQITEALEMSSQTADSSAQSVDRPGKKAKTEEETKESHHPSKDPWSKDPNSISNANVGEVIAERSPLYASLGALVGHQWRSQSDFSAQTDFVVSGINSTQPYADYGKVCPLVSLPSKKPSDAPFFFIDILENSAANSVIQAAKDAGQQLSARDFDRCVVTRSLPVHQSVARCGREQRKGDTEGAALEQVLSHASPYFDIAPETNHYVAEAHFTLHVMQNVRDVKMKKEEDEDEGDAAPAQRTLFPSAVDTKKIHLVSYGMNGVHIITQHKWVLGEVATLSGLTAEPFMDIISLGAHSVVLRLRAPECSLQL